MLDAGDSKARHPGPIDRALPASEFLETEGIALTGFVDGQKATRNRGDYLGLATHNPTGRRRRRQGVESQRFAERADDLCGTNFLILEHYKTSTTLNFCRWAIFNR